jgi:hypothetical protein
VHPPDVAPELVSELETRSRAFICYCSCCSLGGFVGAATAVVMTWAWSWVRVSRHVTDMAAPLRPRSGSANLHVTGIEASRLRVAVLLGHARERAKVMLTRRARRRR